MSIVVGYVPTEPGQAALAVAAKEARLRSTDLVIVNTAVGHNYAKDTFADEKTLDQVSAALTEEGVQFSVRQFDTDDAADALLKVAEETSAELIVIGLRRRSPVAKLVMGSSAQRILLDAPCPVLAVKAS
ncbi:nucleotide-binding universal stress UspA family protein [Motilibacter rhizosphaerae]|uniref:Nucleotide-binding universal stress UspA family protein n=1 Tax=Motilibacter rhizosphaerae TaxID=598652 RepID=A0A4Q7NS41_9ACTN|nr:universal stress protein [Motilibacter rhizosphaerae]RZS89901.1 nucleotide-binding universal stress UspA family protein [Motilibacter rhizosphaerae]